MYIKLVCEGLLVVLAAVKITNVSALSFVFIETS